MPNEENKQLKAGLQYLKLYKAQTADMKTV
jgi:hypothetical protein